MVARSMSSWQQEQTINLLGGLSQLHSASPFAATRFCVVKRSRLIMSFVADLVYVLVLQGRGVAYGG